MKLYIDNKHGSNSISIFFSLLEEEFAKTKTIQIVEPKRAEVILCGPTSSVASQWIGKKKIVQRLDGIYFNSDELQKTLAKNRSIQMLYSRANGVIFQSKYSKNMVEAIIGKCRSHNTIIHNGTQIKEKYVSKASSVFPEVSKMKSDGYTICLAAADWRPVKRMETLLGGFSRYRQTHPKTVLLIAGPSPSPDKTLAKNEGVTYLGKLSHRNMLALYSLSDLLINLSFSDACPNVVVEALVSGKPILASSNQGSEEFYKNNGYIIKEPFSWKFETISYANMPQIPPHLVADGIEKALKIGFVNDVEVTMAGCAAKYGKFLLSIAQE